ncbi:NAD(P)-binding protein [Tothia fuscella]|uniref:NAD(P)-binding protein n=1 Tax=Tothia fuscella TaxID=1048955 RepID=A0A9P4NZW8_9PEZI|nr:NAD(P)-binding protein [Tothia fuscella]
MKQCVTRQDGIKNLKQETGPVPKPGDEEVLVKILAVSLNYRDTEVCNGEYGHHKSVESDKSNLVPCSDMCGTIVSVGSNATIWKTGDRVLSTFNQTHLSGQILEENMSSGLGLPLQGVLTDYRVFPEYGLVKVPNYLSDEEACTLPIAGVTAWTSINWMRPIGDPVTGSDFTILLQGTGGVSIAGLQIAKACDLRIIITSSSDKKLEQAKALGADHTINYKTNPDWQNTVLEITNGKGADFIIETGGALTLAKSFECVAFGGCIAAVGYLSGKEDAEGNRMNTNVLALKRNVTLKGILNGPRDRFEEMLRLYEEKKIQPVVDSVFPFDEAKHAMLYLESGGHIGKVVVRVANPQTVP